MSLAAVAARRLLLRRGATALAALFVASPRTGSYGPATVNGIGGNYAGSPSDPITADAVQKKRSLLGKPFILERDRYWRNKHIRYQAWNSQDPDLTVLHSTSQSWRASIMIERLNSEASLMDTIERRLSAIWEEPLEKVQQLVAVWLRGAL